MSERPVATFVASDAALHETRAFLDAFRRSNPDLPLLLIPGGAEIADVAGLAGRYDFGILDRDFAAFDGLEAICFGADASARGALRLLAAFDLAVPAWVHLDIAMRCGSLAGLLERLSAAAAPTLAADPAAQAVFAAAARLPPALSAQRPFATALFGWGGPSLGSARVIRAVRENLVAYMTCRARGVAAAPVLNVALGWLQIDRLGLDGVLAATLEPPPVAEVVPLRACDVEITILDNGGRYRRGPGRVIAAPGWLEQARAKETRPQMIEPPPALVGRFRDATVQDRGIVVTASGVVVAESLINVAPPVPVMHRRPAAHRDDAGPLVLLKQTWDNNYGHWLVESLPRVELAAECIDLATCRFLVGGDGGAIGRVYCDSLGLLGIEPAQIVASDDIWLCADLIYPAPLTVQPWVKAPRVMRFLSGLGRRVPGRGAGPRRLYVSRNRTGRRVLRNEAAILPRLAALGYVVVEPERMEFADQVRMFADATHVVGNLGAGLTNLAFAPPGVRLLALTTEFMQDDFFWDLLGQLGGSYLSLHGRAADPAAGMQSDFDIDPEMLWPLLAAFDPDGAAA